MQSTTVEGMILIISSEHRIKISESEWKVMEVIWEYGTIQSADVVKKLRLVTDWKDNTVYTLISRLAKKNMIRIDKSVSPDTCVTLVSKEEYCKNEQASFLKRVYNGSLSLMLANIIEDGSLSEDEIADLKKILDSKTGSRGK